MSTQQGVRSSFTQPRARIALVWACVWTWAWLVGGVWGGCPKVCECKWRDGKEVVSCRNAHFIDIPRGLDPSTQVLDLRHNNLRILPKDSFVYTGLVNLQKVWLSFCKLKHLERGAFRMLANVVELDLSHNQLLGVPSASLEDMGGLRHLSLAYNGLTILPTLAFSNTPDLVELDLSHNNLTRLEAGALQNLASLRVLELSHNKLVTLDATELKPLGALGVVHLEGNPWHCDCRLQSLKAVMLERNLAATVRPTCVEPSWLFAGDWLTLDDEELVCAPQVTALAPRVLAAEGENVSLACRVESEVETTITWIIGDNQMLNASEYHRYSLFEAATPFFTSRISNLTIMDVTPQDQGQYRCVAENRAGRREVNLTLQVSHEVAEVRVANIDDNPMTGWVLVGVCVAVVVLVVMVCSTLLYCKVRGPRPHEDEEDKMVAPTPRAATADEHTLAGYHIVPTNELEVSPRRRHSWMHKDISLEDFPSRVLEKGEAQGVLGEAGQVPLATSTTSPSNVAFVEVAKGEGGACGGGAVCGAGEERAAAWRNLSDHQKDLFFHKMCQRSSSQVSVGSGQYPDLLDLPQPQMGQTQPQELYGGSLPLHNLNPSYCTIPRSRSRSCNESSGDVTTTTHTHTHHPHEYHNAGYRSSSALNLALSEAASHAYAQGSLPTRDHPCLPPAHPSHHPLQPFDPRVMHELIAAHRSQCAAGCSQAEGADPYRFEYHAAQLEKFLQEYRCLQEQLYHMKQSYQAQQRSGSAPRLDCCTDSYDPPGPSHHAPHTVPHHVHHPPAPVPHQPPPPGPHPPPPAQYQNSPYPDSPHALPSPPCQGHSLSPHTQPHSPLAPHTQPHPSHPQSHSSIPAHSQAHNVPCALTDATPVRASPTTTARSLPASTSRSSPTSCSRPSPAPASRPRPVLSRSGSTSSSRGPPRVSPPRATSDSPPAKPQQEPLKSILKKPQEGGSHHRQSRGGPSSVT